jgi:hypothetical protein
MVHHVLVPLIIVALWGVALLLCFWPRKLWPWR